MSSEELSSNVAFFDERGDAIIDDLYNVPPDFIDLIYDNLSDVLDPIDFGGGVYAITCRSILVEYQSAKELCNDLGLRRTNQNISMCSAFLAECRSNMDDPYGH